MNLKMEKLGLLLDRDAQKKIGGGTLVCSCTGMPGTWEYRSTPTPQTMVDDINTYCTNGGSCHDVTT